MGKYTFQTDREYLAAKRDVAKIRQLRREGRSTAEICRNYKQQIRDKQFTFESVVGEDFVNGLNKSLFIETDETSARKGLQAPVITPRCARKFNALKAGTVVAFSISLMVVIYALFAQIWRDFRSQERLHTLSSMVEETPQVAGAAIAAAAETVAEAEEAVPEEQPVQRVVMPKYEALKERNADFAGWLKIPDTIIDYPVMYLADDNDYYLSHNFDKMEDVNGLLVLDKRCNEDATGSNILIHGHNMDSGAIFGTLYLYRDYTYWEAHSQINFDSLYEERTYEIIAVFVSSVYNSNANEFAYYDYIQIDNEEDFNTYVKTAKDLSLYDTGKTAVYGDELITLSTCEYSRTNGRLVILGRRLR